MERAVEAAWKELLRQNPGADDLSSTWDAEPFSLVLPYDGIGLRDLVVAALAAATDQDLAQARDLVGKYAAGDARPYDVARRNSGGEP